MKYIGHLTCPQCGYRHISDPKSMIIWFAPDAQKQLVNVKCPGCGRVIEARLDFDDTAAFRSHGVVFKPLTEKFEPLTEQSIDEWDIDRELNNADKV